MADKAVLNLSLGPELGLNTPGEPRPKSTFSPHQLQQQLGHRVVLCMFGMLGLEEVNAVPAEHSNLHLFVPLSFPEEFRWGRTAGSHLIQTPAQSRTHMGSACPSAGHLKQSFITFAVNYIFPFHLVGVFPAAAWDCCSPSPRWARPCREVCCVVFP